MSEPIPLELILIVGGAAISFLMFILICFCTRNRIEERRNYNHQGHSTYVGAIGWFQRYRDRNNSKSDDASNFDNRL